MKSVTKTQFNWTLVWFLVLIFVGSVLLMTGFFVFTISASKPTKLELFSPKETQEVEKQYASNGKAALTVILATNNVIHYYEGELMENGSNLKSSNYTDIRKIIVDKKQSTDSSKFVIIIKPAEGASYRNTVDILDEMTINDVKRYTMVDISPKEKELIARK